MFYGNSRLNDFPFVWFCYDHDDEMSRLLPKNGHWQQDYVLAGAVMACTLDSTRQSVE